MKKRNGFVSNSSSASFIIRWKGWEGYDDPENELDSILDNLFYDEDLQQNIKRHTTKEEDIYRTEFTTSMYNDMSDFTNAAIFLMALEMGRDYRFEVVEKMIVEE